MKLSDESGLMENEIENILIKLQARSISKLDENKRFNNEGIAIFKLKIIGNNNQTSPVINYKKQLFLIKVYNALIIF